MVRKSFPPSLIRPSFIIPYSGQKKTFPLLVGRHQGERDNAILLRIFLCHFLFTSVQFKEQKIEWKRESFEAGQLRGFGNAQCECLQIRRKIFSDALLFIYKLFIPLPFIRKCILNKVGNLLNLKLLKTNSTEA